MIKSVNYYSVSQLFATDTSITYAVPKYQREYTWTHNQWEKLFDDIVENNQGYFLGSIICINQSSDALDIQELEVVDGQQRITTLSLLIAAIYDELKSRELQLDDEQKLELLNLKRKLVLKKFNDKFRVIPQLQNNNHDDYRAVLSEIGIIGSYNKPSNAGNRKIFKAFRFFKDCIQNFVAKDPNAINSLMTLLEKVNQSVLVKIEVFNHADAYTLFESLNNRGMPLTAIDLIKNALLAKIDGDKDDLDYYFNQWKSLLNYLTDDYQIQERFFRHYYNAFKTELNEPFKQNTKKKDPLGPIATKSNLMHIYQELIKVDATGFLKEILIAGEYYSIIIGNSNDSKGMPFKVSLSNLERIQGAPSYLLILYLFIRKSEFEIEDSTLNEIIILLTKFFVRRNLTDVPATRDLTRIFMSIIEKVEGQEKVNIYEIIKTSLVNVSVSEFVFEEKLRGKIYTHNYSATRFILCTLEELGMTKETFRDLWRVEKKQNVWTIEHILPQGENIPVEWVNMIAEGDPKKAKEIQEKYVHTLGNLTISGYNSTLGNKSFEIKRDRVDSNKNYVGYKNGLKLNQDLKDEDKWTIEKIEARTDKLVKEALDTFKLLV